jgi:type IV pilus secretin PilQ/predicted competence protein
MRFVRGFLVVMTLWGAGSGAAQAADAPGPPRELRDVKVEQRAAAVAVTVVTSGQPKYETTLLDSPVRVVIDINGTFASPRSRWTGVPEPLKEVRGSQFKPGTARPVVELNRKAGYRIEEGPQGLTVLIDAPAGPATAETSPVPKRPAAALPDLPRMPEAAKPSDAPKAASALRVIEPTRAERKPAVAMPAASTTAPGIVARHPEPVRPAALAPVVVAQAATTPAPAAASASAPAAPNGPKLITLEFKDADVINLLRILSAESGRNIVAGDDVKGKLSVSLRNVTWEQALDTILEVKGLQKIDKGGVIRIISIEQLAKEREAQARADDAKRKAEIDARTKEAEAQLKESEVANRKLQADLAAAEAQSRGPLREEVIRLSYADPEDVAKTLQGILGIPAEGAQPIAGTQGITAPGGPPLIAEPPFSALYGLGLQQQQARPQVVSVSQDVLAKGLTIRANKATNSIFLRLHAADLDRIKKLVREYFDVPLPQVKIEARMEILDRTALEAIGIQWGGAGAGNVGRATVVGQGFQSPFRVPGTGVTNVNPVNPNLNLGGLLPVFPDTALPLGGNLVNLPISTLPNSGALLPAGGIAFGIIGTNWNINLALQALATLGKTRTLARPEIVTVENNKAEISLGEEIPYATVSSAGTQIQFKDALLKLATTPTVIRTRVDGRDETKIKLVVVVENNSRGDVVNLGSSGSPPAINKRKAETLVLLNEGERLVIGGVTTSTNQNTVRKVPYLGDIPFLGWAFKQREIFEQGREMVVFLTPSVLKGVTSPASSPK